MNNRLFAKQSHFLLSEGLPFVEKMKAVAYIGHSEAKTEARHDTRHEPKNPRPHLTLHARPSFNRCVAMSTDDPVEVKKSYLFFSVADWVIPMMKVFGISSKK